MFADGTSGADRYRGQLSYDHNVNEMAFATNGSEAARFDSSQNLLVGKTAAGIANTGSEFSSTGRAFFTFDGGGPLQLNRKSSDGDIIELHKDGTEVGSIGVSGGNNLYISSSQTNHAGLTFATDAILPTRQGATTNGVTDLGANSEKFKDLYLSGIANVGGTAKFASWSNSGASSGIEIRSTSGQILNSHTGTALHVYQYFYNANGVVGSISASGSTTAYNTSSDHRLKENVADLTGATTRLKQLEPKRFNFIADADTTVDGFLAHEVQSVVPEAITGTHNEVDDDGNPVYQGIDQSKLVPLLVATIKELEARITALEGA